MVVWELVLGTQWSLLALGALCVVVAAGLAANGVLGDVRNSRGERFTGPVHRTAVRVLIPAAIIWWTVSLIVLTIEALRWLVRWSAVDAATVSLFLSSGFLVFVTAMLLPERFNGWKRGGRIWRSCALVFALAALAVFWDVRWLATPLAPPPPPARGLPLVGLCAAGFLSTLVAAWASATVWFIAAADWLCRRRIGWRGILVIGERNGDCTKGSS